MKSKNMFTILLSNLTIIVSDKNAINRKKTWEQINESQIDVNN